MRSASHIEPHQLVSQDDAESVQISSVISSQQPFELKRSVPQRGIFKEQPRCQSCVRVDPLDRCWNHFRLEIEIHHSGENARFVALVIFMTSRNEREFPF